MVRRSANIKNNKKNCRLIISTIIIALMLFFTIIFEWIYISAFFHDPFFWAFISMFGLIGASATLCSKQLGRFMLLNLTFVVIFAFGRFILVQPFCPQPRFDFGSLQFAFGGIIFFIGLIFLIPILLINPWPVSKEDIKLQTHGFYGIIRNPIYLGEIMWTLGWAIMFGSIIGIILVPLWWGGLLFNTILEEEDLERKIGRTYLNYKNKVNGRIIPGLPI